MRYRWLLIMAAGFMVSADAPQADAPQKEASYEKAAKEPARDYLRVEIRGTLQVKEWRGSGGWHGEKLFAWIHPDLKVEEDPGVVWELSLDGSKELQEVVRKLKGTKVVMRGFATEPRRRRFGVSAIGGPLQSDVEVTSLRGARDKK